MWQQRHNVVVATAAVFLAVGLGTPFYLWIDGFENGEPHPVDWVSPWLGASTLVGVVGAVLLLSAFTGWPMHALAPGRDEVEAQDRVAAARQKRDHLGQLSQKGDEIRHRRGEGGFKQKMEDGERWITDTADWIESNYSIGDREIFVAGLPRRSDSPRTWVDRMERAIANLSKILERP